MSDFNFSSVKELKSLLKDKSFRKILLLCGQNSFEASGASNLFKDLL